MIKRHHQILIALLVVQIALTAAVLWPREVASGTGEPLFPALAEEEVVALEVTDDQGGSIALAKDGDEFVLPDAGDYPARAAPVEELVAALQELDTRTLVAQTATSHDRLQVAEDEFVRRVVFETAEGTEGILYLGSAPRYSATHVRVAGQDQVYLTDELTSWQVAATPSGWVDTGYLRVDQNALVKVRVENEGGTLTFVRQEDGTWALDELDEGQVNATQVNGLISGLSALSLQRPLGQEELEEYGMDDPSAVVELDTGSETYTLTVGAYLEDDGAYVVKASDSPYYVTVPSHALRAAVEDAPEDFAAAEEPPPAP
jgi:hypothetical protein